MAEMQVVKVEVAAKSAHAAGNPAEARGTYHVDEHMMLPREVAERYETQVDWSNIPASAGLTSSQVERRRVQHGLNQLTPPKDTPEVIKFLKQLANPLMLLLLTAGGLTYMAYGIQSLKDKNNIIMATALVLVVLLTCTMTYLQEKSASDVMNSLRKMMPSKCTVYRDGKEEKVAASELVPGDLVRLYIGDRVPADIRMVESSELKVECSSLTGESDLVPATVDCKSDIPEHCHCLVFMSTLCMNGEGRGIVIRTGDNTMIGKIAALAGSTGTQRSTLQVEVHRLVLFVGVLAFTTAIVLFSIGLGRRFEPLVAFVNGFILVIVANVPEGLPATVTSLLTLTAMRLKEKNVLIKRTDIIENLGCASIIASDKTGTLTQNKMSVENVWCNCHLNRAAQFIPVDTSRLASLSRTSRLNSINRASRRILEKSSRPMPKVQEGTDGAQPDFPSLASRTLPAGHPEICVASRPLSPAGPEMSNLAAVSRMALGRQSMGTTEEGRMQYRPSLETRSRGLAASMAVPEELRAGYGPYVIAQIHGPDSINWSASSALTRLATIATVCNKARFADSPIEGESGGHVAVPMDTRQAMDDRQTLGDATDSGLLRYCDRLMSSAAVRLAYPTLFSIPFNSANKWSLAVTKCPGSGSSQHLVMMKGAPEIVLGKCSHYFQNSKELPISAEFNEEMQAAYERCGFMGERVIGFAYKVVPSCVPEAYKEEGQGPPTEGLVFMGLISLVDPPRQGVLEAVQRCRTAGIRVAMVTGDHPLTAEAIARKVGIVTLKTAREVAAEHGMPESEVPQNHPDVGAVIITGAHLRDIKTVEEWDEILDHEEVVFARTSPQQKLQIVENLQRRGEVVAVTGDGVNDSPALKRAQIGVAMGLGGSDVARDAADIVLMDDEFPSIVNAIEEGRVIYDNLKKTIAYTLTHAVPEVWPIFLNLVLSFPLGLGGLLILSIDLLTEQGPAISLAYEKAEDNIMARPPRDVEDDRLINGVLLRYSYFVAGIVEAAVCTLGFFTIFWWYGVRVPDLLWSQDPANGYFLSPPGDKMYRSDRACSLGSGLNDREACLALDGSVPAAGASGYIWYSGEKQFHIYTEAQACYYVSLVMCQFWHIWLCKTRQVSIFKHGIFGNPVTFYGSAVSIATVLIIVYIPGLHGIFLTNNLGGIGWVPNLLFLLIMLPFTEYSKWCARNRPEGWWSRQVAF